MADSTGRPEGRNASPEAHPRPDSHDEAPRRERSEGGNGRHIPYERPGDLDIIRKELLELKERVEALASAGVEYALAQWNYASFKAKEEARLLAGKTILGAIGAVFLLVTWIFMMIGVWMAVDHFCPEPYAAPVTVAFIHAVVGLWALLRIRKMSL